MERESGGGGLNEEGETLVHGGQRVAHLLDVSRLGRCRLGVGREVITKPYKYVYVEH